MSTLPYPNVDQLVTGIAVANGEVSVLTGKVLVSRAHSLAIDFDADHLETPLGRGHVVTLMYSSQEFILRLKTNIDEVLDDGRFLLKPSAEVSKGERREFLRANVSARIRVDRHEGSTPPPAETSVTTTGSLGQAQEVDLSGSGIRLDCEVTAKKGDTLVVNLALEDRPKITLSLPGTVVRCKPHADGRLSNVAVHFLDIEEETQDQLINGVFRWYYEQLGGQMVALAKSDA